MDIIKLLENRYSVRDYAPTPIKDEDLDKILLSARLAPSAKNLEPHKIIVVKSKEALEKLRAAAKAAFNAPVVLVVCVDYKEAWERRDGWNSAETDAAIVCDHMMITAASLSLGSVWACAFDKEAVAKAIGLEENLTPLSLLPIGYPSENAEPSERHALRKALKDTVKFI